MAKTESEITQGANGAKARKPAAPRDFDVLLRGGRVIDPARGIDGVFDVAVAGGTIAQVAPKIAGTARRTVDARRRLVLPGMIDTHCHIYQHVTGSFGMNPDEVGIRSGVTAVVDQGGAAPLTVHGFRKFIKEPATTRVYAYISNYLVGGLVGHRHVGLYGPHGINVKETIKAIEENRDMIKGIKCHAEVGGYSRWGIETLRLGKEASRAAKVPVYVHLGRLWAEENGTRIDPDSVMADVVPLLDPGDVLAHPFTKHPGAFVSSEGKVHPLIFEAMARGVRIDIGRGGHMSFNAARIALDAGVMPFTVGGDIHGYTIRRRDESGVWDAGSFGGEKGGQLMSVGGTGVFTLVQVMNELMALGVGLPDVVRMVTANAAAMLSLEDEIGTLAPGRVADVSVLAIDDGDFVLQDSLGVRIPATKRLRPVLALRAGKVHRPESPLLVEEVPEVA
jgi:dihydroorotase